ncbi:phosphatidate cytidylyltransferase [Pontixanthobacter sp.]|uniref:phosphatidate cytidylyltransferase n=1 Tax=Pontixanthobacter sp. TaxID=2792078 RepID=UPI003C79C920
MSATEPVKNNSDLPVRVASAIIMLVIAGGALWFGGWLWYGFVALVAGACFFELARLVRKAFGSGLRATLGVLAGAAYVGLAGLSLVNLPTGVLLGVILVVIGTDVGAYFSGRAIGGPKIAPTISPSKTWAGLVGGALLAGTVSMSLFVYNVGALTLSVMLIIAFLIGAALAVVAQCGDFLESWLKRKAGQKDSSTLIPGHGGVFDRIDGLLPVAIAAMPLWALHPA